MEIDIKVEQEKVQGEIQQLTEKVNQINNSLCLLQQQRQEVINQLLMKQGQLELLQRLNGNKEETP